MQRLVLICFYIKDTAFDGQIPTHTLLSSSNAAGAEMWLTTVGTEMWLTTVGTTKMKKPSQTPRAYLVPLLQLMPLYHEHN